MRPVEEGFKGDTRVAEVYDSGDRHAWLHVQIQSSTFSQNTAKSSGSVLLADDDSQISFVGCTMTNNGNFSCYDPPTVSPSALPCR